jgi:hypothetical protein
MMLLLLLLLLLPSCVRLKQGLWVVGWFAGRWADSSYFRKCDGAKLAETPKNTKKDDL